MVSVKIHKPSISVMKSNKIYEKEKIIHNNLVLNYAKFEYSYSSLCINNLMFNEHCQVVARFKDFLILDDMTEFLRRFYSRKELKKRLIKIFNFYESYSKIFPNYMILPESKYLYRNIRKKQKMIDAFNQIKKEEEENRNSLKKELNKKEKREIIIFNKSIQDSINRYHPSTSSFLFNSIISGFAKNNNHNNNESNYNSIINISLSKPYNFNNKKINNNKYSTQNSLEFDNDEISLNSENSLINIVQILNKKYDNNHNSNNYKINLKGINNNNNKEKENNKTINNYNDKTKKKKNLIKKQVKNKKSNKVNFINENNTKNGKEKQNKISTPPRNSSPGHNQLVKHHNHQKSALNNNKKFISHKQAVSVSNNTNTIKIINNINNIIINDGNINKEMVININTNYFELNNAHLNTINNINNFNDNNNENIHNKNKNTLIKKVNIKSKSKSKETSINNKKDNNILKKKLNNNYKIENNFINNTLEERRTYAYSNNIVNNFNYPNNNIINNKMININNTTGANNIKTNNNKSKSKKQNTDNKSIKGISEYKTININNIGNIGNLYNNKINNNYNKIDRNKKAITIDVDPYDKSKKSQSKQRKNLEIIIGKEDKKSINKHKFSTKPKNRRTFQILNTDVKINYNINPNKYSNNYINTESSNNTKNNFNIKNDKKEIKCIKSNHIQSKLNKRIMSRKQKTNSLHIKSKNIYFSSFNNNKLTKEINSLKRNNISNNDNFINEHIKNFTQGNLDLETTKTKKFINLKENKEISEKKIKKISAVEMKKKYHKFMQGNKYIHGSYDTSNRLHLFKKFSSLYNNHNTNLNNITEISQRKIIDKNSPFKISNIINTPGSKISNKNVRSSLTKNIFGSNLKNYDKTTFKKKIQINKKDDTQDKNKYLIYKINGFKNKIIISDGNNKKMKFVKK